MSWRSAVEIKAYLAPLAGETQLGRLFALSYLWRNAFLPAPYEADPSWSSIVAFRADAADVIDSLAAARDLGGDADYSLALFRVFAHHELFVGI